MFHHALGLTEGMREFASRLRAAGHEVYTPDLYDGDTHSHIDEGVAHAERIGHDRIIAAGLAAAAEHLDATVAIGFSLGAMPAQALVQTQDRFVGCVLMGSVVPPAALGSHWRREVPVEIHLADPDEWWEQDELDALCAEAPHHEVFRYEGAMHLFPDRSVRDYDGDAADRFEDRVLAFLERVAPAQ